MVVCYSVQIAHLFLSSMVSVWANVHIFLFKNVSCFHGFDITINAKQNGVESYRENELYDGWQYEHFLDIFLRGKFVVQKIKLKT